jgi:alkylhydroperoxidase family enzyme
MDRQFDVLYGYLALAKRPGNSGGVVDERTRLLVRQLAAERSGCRWCIERARHDWRAGGLPVDLLRDLGRHASCAGFSERERAALALVDSVACPVAAAAEAGETLARVRRHFSEAAVADLIACMAEHHLIADDRS